ncbi:MAG TPA: hypothetical protein VFV19_09755 [Candidatus Polarisedimenticolaceae bacterium]|nr:hypothetical protein [Candidatus Polarisedimenticolaceae bacterium]
MSALRWIWPLLAVALAVLIPWAGYEWRPARPLPLVVLDKTVPFRNWIEHRSLFWLLEHDRIVHADGTPYAFDRDYLGAHPPPLAGDPPERTRDLAAEDVRGARLVYLADTYGVYRDDLRSGARMAAALERSPKIYGGLTTAEAEAAAEAPRQGKTLVAEFNTLGSPTGADARGILESALGVRWTRWIGRYFPHLDDRAEVPQWMREDYEREWKKPWQFEGPGYVLMQDDEHCEVLRIGPEAEAIGLTIERDEKKGTLDHAADLVPYPYWFDVVEERGATRLASFQWHLTEAGRSRLAARKLPARFPAVTRMGTAWYFAGDFADNPMDPRPVPFLGYTVFRRFAEGMKLAPSETAFYWRFYVPMMQAILRDAQAAR